MTTMYISVRSCRAGDLGELLSHVTHVDQERTEDAGRDDVVEHDRGEDDAVGEVDGGTFVDEPEGDGHRHGDVPVGEEPLEEVLAEGGPDRGDVARDHLGDVASH